MRDGNSRSVPASELVPGDIIEIRAGNKVPADLRLCEVSGDLKFDRSVLTGESKPIQGSVNFTDDNLLEVDPGLLEVLTVIEQEYCHAGHVLYCWLGCRNLYLDGRQHCLRKNCKTFRRETNWNDDLAKRNPTFCIDHQFSNTLLFCRGHRLMGVVATCSTPRFLERRWASDFCGFSECGIHPRGYYPVS